MKFNKTAYEHMQDYDRYVPRTILARAIVNGKKGSDRQKDYSSYTSAMYRNGTAYKLKVVYNKKTKRVQHFHYQKYR